MSWETKLSGVKVDNASVTIIHKENALDNFELKIPNTQAYRDLVGYGNSVVIKYMGETTISGYCDRPRFSDNHISIKGLEEAGELLKVMVSDGASYHRRYYDVAASTILTDLLAMEGGNYSLDATLRPEPTMSMAFQYIDVYSSIQKVGEILGKDHWFTGRTLKMSGTRGTSKGKINYIDVAEKTVNYDDIENAIYITYNTSGAEGTGTEQTLLITDANSISTYGSRIKFYTASEIFDSTTVRTLGTAVLDDRAQPPTNIPVKISVPYLYERNLSVGDSITLDLPQKNIDGSYKIKKISIGKTSVTLETSIERNSLEEIIKSLRKDVGLREKSRKACVYTCQLACQDTCQSQCQTTAQECSAAKSCQTSCQGGHRCQSSCQSACQAACQETCQDACQTACQAGCQTCCEQCSMACYAYQSV